MRSPHKMMADKTVTAEVQRFKDSIHNGMLIIDGDAVKDNYRTLCQRVHPAECAAVIKASAYGIGVEYIAPLLYEAGCRYFFVAELAEGMALRELMPEEIHIMILNGVAPAHMALAYQQRINPVLNTLAQTQQWMALIMQQGKFSPVFLQCDTGMSRFGLSDSERQSLTTSLSQQSVSHIDYVMTHFSHATADDMSMNNQQLQRLLACKQTFPNAKLTLANSAGSLVSLSDYRLDMCRPGAILFGAKVAHFLPALKPVISLYLKVLQVRTVPAGTGVGYEATQVTEKTSKIATISAGYADGIPRNLSAETGVWLGDNKLPLMGRVCMDCFMVDASHIDDDAIEEGSIVEFIGEHQSISDIALCCGTIDYEILTRIGNRYTKSMLRGVTGDDGTMA